MNEYFCPACWSIVSENAETCPQCGAELSRYRRLSLEQRYLIALRHPKTDKRLLAVRYLGKLGSRKALIEFERILEEEKEYPVLCEVVRALTLIHDPQAHRLLKKTSDHPHYLISLLAKHYLDAETG